MTFWLWFLVVFAIFIIAPVLVAYALPATASRRIARFMASVALALQFVATVYMAIWGFSSQWAGLETTLVYVVVPLTPNAAATYLAFRNPPAAASVLSVGVVLLLLSMLLIFSIGMIMFLPGLLTLLAGLFLVGSWRRDSRRSTMDETVYART